MKSIQAFCHAYKGVLQLNKFGATSLRYLSSQSIKVEVQPTSGMYSEKNSSIIWLLTFMLLQSKSLSGKCAKLHTVAASNNRDHVPWSLYYCLFAPYICGVILHVHLVRGDLHIQRNAERLQPRHLLAIVFYFYHLRTNVQTANVCFL